MQGLGAPTPTQSKIHICVLTPPDVITNGRLLARSLTERMNSWLTHVWYVTCVLYCILRMREKRKYSGNHSEEKIQHCTYLLQTSVVRGQVHLPKPCHRPLNAQAQPRCACPGYRLKFCPRWGGRVAVGCVAGPRIAQESRGNAGSFGGERD